MIAKCKLAAGLFSAAILLLISTGCSVKSVNVTKPDGTQVSVNWSSLLRDDAAEGLSYGRVDDEILLELGQLGSKTDWAAIQKMAEVMGAVTSPVPAP